MTYAILNADNLVVNVIEWDGKSEWAPPAGHTIEPLTTGGIGWSFINGEFIAPAPEEVVES